MKLSAESQLVATNISNENMHRFTFKNTSKLFDILSNSLYSDKFGSIIRELSSNAVDSHIAADKKDIPFEIILPSLDNTELHETLSIKDFGTGISEEDIYRIYTCYGESTRSESDDFIGCYGIGSKSPFCITKSFTVISIVDGEKKSYLIFIDDQGFPVITKISDEYTTECNGFEVVIPIKKEDIDKFEEAILSQLNRFYPEPIVVNGSDTLYKRIKEKDLTRIIIFSGNTWKIGITKSISTIVDVIVGNIKYPIHISKLNHHIQKFLRCFSLVELDFNIGELELSASRESLQFSEKTLNALNTKCIIMIKEFFILLEDFDENNPQIFLDLIKTRSTDPYYTRIAEFIKTLKSIASELKIPSLKILNYNGTNLNSYLDDMKICIFVNDPTGYYFRKIADLKSINIEAKNIKRFVTECIHNNLFLINSSESNSADGIIPLCEDIPIIYSTLPSAITKDYIKDSSFPSISGDKKYIINYNKVDCGIYVSPRKRLQSEKEVKIFTKKAKDFANSMSSKKLMEVESRDTQALKRSYKKEKEFTLYASRILDSTYIMNMHFLKNKVFTDNYKSKEEIARRVMMHNKIHNVFTMVGESYFCIYSRSTNTMDAIGFYAEILKENLGKVLFITAKDYQTLCHMGLQDEIDKRLFIKYVDRLVKNVSSTVTDQIKSYIEYEKLDRFLSSYDTKKKFSIFRFNYSSRDMHTIIRRLVTVLHKDDIINPSNKLMSLLAKFRTYSHVSELKDVFVLEDIKFPNLYTLKKIMGSKIENTVTLKLDIIDDLCNELSKYPLLLINSDIHSSISENTKEIIREYILGNFHKIDN